MVGWDGDSVKKELVYLIYDHDMNLVVEIESCSQLTLTYFRKAEGVSQNKT